MASFIRRRLLASHSRIESLNRFGIEVFKLCAGGSAIVRHENQNRVFRQTEFLQMLSQLPEVVIDVGDHSVEVRAASAPRNCLLVRIAPLRIDSIGTMRCVRRQVKQERLFLVVLYKAMSFAKPNVGAIAIELLKLTISFISVVEVVVTPVVRRLPDSTASMPDHILEASVLRSMRRVITQVPLADHSRHVTRIGEHICDCSFVGVQHRPTGTSSIRSRASRIAASHQRGASWGAKRADVKGRSIGSIPRRVDRGSAS